MLFPLRCYTACNFNYSPCAVVRRRVSECVCVRERERASSARALERCAPPNNFLSWYTEARLFFTHSRAHKTYGTRLNYIITSNLCLVWVSVVCESRVNSARRLAPRSHALSSLLLIQHNMAPRQICTGRLNAN
jgi:hypothetical protein